VKWLIHGNTRNGGVSIGFGSYELRIDIEWQKLCWKIYSRPSNDLGIVVVCSINCMTFSRMEIS